MSWYQSIKDKNDDLNNSLRHINHTISKYNDDA